mmetsp:Transcript_38818/g.62196  ORF Transcript_38818/g.62196 Transcript_38818/m.62196 type:complete len:125 (-) Transcript_38818:253-627(-)
MENNEREFYFAKRERDVSRKLSAVKRTQNLERKALNKKAETAKSNAEKQRDIEVEALRLKFKNRGARSMSEMNVTIAKRSLKSEKWASAVRKHETQVPVKIREKKDIRLAAHPNSQLTTRKLVL